MIENHSSFCDQLLVQIVVYSSALCQRAAGFHYCCVCGTVL